MHAEFEKRWRRQTAKVWSHICPDNPQGMGLMFSGMRRHLPDTFETWDETIQRAAFDRYVPNGFRPPEPRDADVIRCVRMGLALAAGDHSILSSSEKECLAALGFDDVDTPCRPTKPPPPGDAFTLDFAFVYRGIKAGSRSARGWIASRGTTVVQRLEPGTSAPAYSMPIPGGGSLEVVDVDGALYRPVLWPGSWDPLTEADFVQACQGDDGWADDPFAAKGHRSHSAYPLAPRETGRSAAYGVGREEALAECLARGAGLLSIDGIVHVRTETPKYSPVIKGQDHVMLGWRIDRLSSIDDPSPLAAVPPSTDWSCGFSTPGGLKPGDPVASFPPEAFEAASGLARSLAVALVVFYEPPDAPTTRSGAADCAALTRELLGALPFVPECDVWLRWMKSESAPGTPEAFEAAAKGIGSLSRLEGRTLRVLAFARAAAQTAAKAAAGAYVPAEEFEAESLVF